MRSRLVISALLMTLASPSPAHARRLGLGDEAPDFSAKVLGIKSVEPPKVTLSKTRGRIRILSFNMSHCPFCISNSQQLSEMQKLNTNLELLSVFPARDSESDVESYYRRAGIASSPRSRAVHDSAGKLWSDYSIVGTPMTFVLDENGKVLFKYSGAMNDAVRQRMYHAVPALGPNNAVENALKPSLRSGAADPRVSDRERADKGGEPGGPFSGEAGAGASSGSARVR